ncbi:MAG: DUF58 domain-containing protein [Deltaproteobacteria bacterium]|jgi:uncharacterized protein (DUF58 family)|nr:DUF58 domain-containing protein [Deltaproteobacteria bacterium]
MTQASQQEAGQKSSLYMRPTPKAVLWFAWSIPVALILVIGWRDIWYFSLYWPAACLALILADMGMALPGRTLEAALKAPQRLYVGQAGTVELALAAPGHSREVPVQALLEYGGGNELTGLPEAWADTLEDPEPAVGLLRGGELGLELPLRPRRRGRAALKALWLRWRGPLRLIEFRRRDGLHLQVDVMPDVRGIHETALRFFARDAVYGLKTQRMRGEGTEFDTLCEYLPGMDQRFIDWKRSARHRKLLCKEFKQERNHQIVLGLDTGHLMLEPLEGLPKLDHAIKAGLLLGWVSLYSGDLVGGCGFDLRFRSFLKPGRGMPYFKQFQRFTSGLDYHAEETNFTLGLAELNARLQRRALIVLFTEFVDSISAELLLESLQIMTRRHVVVFVTMRDPMLPGLREARPGDFPRLAEAVLADDFLRERSVVLERVARLGVHCIDAPVRAVSGELLNRYLMIKQRGLL